MIGAVAHQKDFARLVGLTPFRRRFGDQQDGLIGASVDEARVNAGKARLAAFERPAFRTASQFALVAVLRVLAAQHQIVKKRRCRLDRKDQRARSRILLSVAPMHPGLPPDGTDHPH